jgi:hypothetical protein
VTELVIRTLDNGYNAGRTYVHTIPEQEAQDWVQDLNSLILAAQLREKERLLRKEFGENTVALFRAKTRIWYLSPAVQYVVIAMILLGFLVDIIEAQMADDIGLGEDTMSTQQEATRTFFLAANMLFTFLFFSDVCVNAFAHSDDYFKPFLQSWANIFDAVHAIVSVAHVALILQTNDSLLKGTIAIKILRCARFLRIVRVFRNVQALQQIVNAITAAFFPMLNALFILFIVCSVYATIGTHLFREKSEEYFGNFASSLWTMMQTLVRI